MAHAAPNDDGRHASDRRSAAATTVRRWAQRGGRLPHLPRAGRNSPPLDSVMDRPSARPQPTGPAAYLGALPTGSGFTRTETRGCLARGWWFTEVVCCLPTDWHTAILCRLPKVGTDAILASAD